MTIQQVAGSRRSLRRTQQVADGSNTTSAAPGSPAPADMSLLSNATSYVDNTGIGHVRVNDNLDWSGIFSNDSTAHIAYAGSGPAKEILIIPARWKASESSFSDNNSIPEDSSTNPVMSPPTRSDDSSSTDSVVLTGTGSNSVVLIIVGTALVLIAIVSVLAVAVYSRRNRRRACSADSSSTDEPFIVGSLPHQPVPELSLLDTDMSPDLWVEGQYQYSPNMSQLINSFNGTAILSDNNTTRMHQRLTVDAIPSSRQGHRRNGGRGDARHDQRGDAGRDHAECGNSMRRGSDDSRVHSGSRVRGGSHVYGGSRVHSRGIRSDRNILDDISDRGRRRRGTTPIVLYDESSTEEHKSNSSRMNNRSRPSQSSQQQRQRYQDQQQQRRHDKYDIRRDR